MVFKVPSNPTHSKILGEMWGFFDPGLVEALSKAHGLGAVLEGLAAVLMVGHWQVTTTAGISEALQAEGEVNFHFGHYRHVAVQLGLAGEGLRGLIHMRRAGRDRAGGCW